MRVGLLASSSFPAPLGLNRAGEGRPAPFDYLPYGLGAAVWRRWLHHNNRSSERGGVQCEVFRREADAEGEGGPLEPPQRHPHSPSFLSIRMRSISGPVVSAEEQVDRESNVRWGFNSTRGDGENAGVLELGRAPIRARRRKCGGERLLRSRGIVVVVSLVVGRGREGKWSEFGVGGEKGDDGEETKGSNTPAIN